MTDQTSHQADAQASGTSNYRRLLSYALKYWKIFIISIISMAVVAAAATAFAALMKPLMDGSFVERDPLTIKWIPLILIGIYLVRAIAVFLSMYGMSLVGRNVILELRQQMFSRMLHLPKAFYDKSTTGEVISKFTYDVEQVANASTRAVTVVVRDTLTAIGLVGWMFYLNATLATTFVVAGPFIAGLVVYVSKRFRNISKRIQGSMGSVTRVLEEAIKSQIVVKVFGGSEYEKQQFLAVNQQNRRQNLKMVMTSALSTPIIQLIVAIALAGIIYIATHDSMQGQITVGAFTSFMVAMFMLFAPIRQLTQVNAELQRGIAAAESIFAFIDLEQEKDTGSYATERVKGAIEFDKVSFNYASGEKHALKTSSFSIQPGQTVAFVGRSGSGKTTLLNLLPRLYDVTEGVIRLDGRDIRDYTLDNLRAQIAYVGQDIVLFNDTIEHNIAYGALQSTDKNKIENAARLAHSIEFINNMELGFNTVVGERGVMLSGGQRQRIAIARALLKDAPVLILDEATSALDTESERFIQDSLQQLMKDRTTLVIAHRLSTIENADVIMVLDEGRIVESGSHEELLQRNGHYASLYRMQFGDAENTVT